jgi:lipoprotein-releasing system permease protein
MDANAPEAQGVGATRKGFRLDEEQGHHPRPASLRSRMVAFLLYRFFVSSWLRRRTRSQAAIGVVLPIIGVGVGVASFTIVLSIMGGFVANLKQRLLGIESHVDIVRSGSFGHLPHDASLVKRIRGVPGVLGVSPFQIGDSILQSASRPVTVTILGVDPLHGEVFKRFESTFARGTALGDLGELQSVAARSGGMVGSRPGERTGTNGALRGEDGAQFPGVVLGEGLARALGVSAGDRVTFVSTLPEEGAFGLAPKQWPAVVMDTFETGSSRYDGKVVLVHIDFANRFFNVTDGAWAGLQVLVEQPEEVDTVSRSLDALVGSMGFRAKPWTESNAALLRALRLERWGMSFVLYMVILVGCFTISITLVLSVRRKAREMAILRAIGFARRELGQVYILQGLLIGAVGVVLGLVVGLAALHLLSTADVPWLTGAYNGKPFPVLVDWTDCGRVVVGSLVLAAIASFWPAWEVMRIDVVETLSDRM